MLSRSRAGCWRLVACLSAIVWLAADCSPVRAGAQFAPVPGIAEPTNQIRTAPAPPAATFAPLTNRPPRSQASEIPDSAWPGPAPVTIVAAKGPAVPGLDLRAPMALAARAIPPRLDPAQDYRPWFLIRGSNGIPSTPEHASWDLGDMTGRYLDGLILARRMGITAP